MGRGIPTYFHPLYYNLACCRAAVKSRKRTENKQAPLSAARQPLSPDLLLAIHEVMMGRATLSKSTAT
jgi:hypothetical protein